MPILTVWGLILARGPVNHDAKLETLRARYGGFARLSLREFGLFVALKVRFSMVHGLNYGAREAPIMTAWDLFLARGSVK